MAHALLGWSSFSDVGGGEVSDVLSSISSLFLFLPRSVDAPSPGVASVDDDDDNDDDDDAEEEADRQLAKQF
jgi:hypothetical protein